MDENNNSSNQEDKFQMKPFLWGFLSMLIPYVGAFFGFQLNTGYGIIGAFFLALLFIVIGMVLWVIIRVAFNKRFAALGVLVGSFTPILVMFIFTGGCGIFL